MKKTNTNRDSYTFLELLLALKNEYKEVGKLLQELTELVSVSADCPVEKEIRLALMDGSYYDLRDPRISLFLTKKLNIFEKSARDVAYRGLNESQKALFNKDVAKYVLKGDTLVAFKHITDYKERFESKIDAVDPNFRGVFLELSNKPFYHLYAINVRLNQHQTLIVAGDSISITDHTISDQSAIRSVKYVFAEDKVYLTKKAGKKNRDELEDLFQAEIPTYKLPQQYQSMLRKHFGEKGNMYIKVSSTLPMKSKAHVASSQVLVDDYNEKKTCYTLSRK